MFNEYMMAKQWENLCVDDCENGNGMMRACLKHMINIFHCYHTFPLESTTSNTVKT